MTHPSILCPVDFSEPSCVALSYAAAIADHFGARLTVLPVDDRLLAEAAATTGRVRSLAQETENELRRFVGDTLQQPDIGPKQVAFRLAVGKPAAEILETRDVRVMDMGLHSSDRLGPRMGSVTSRVLCLTRALVLALRPRPDASGPVAHSSHFASVVV